MHVRNECELCRCAMPRSLPICPPVSSWLLLAVRRPARRLMVRLIVTMPVDGWMGGLAMPGDLSSLGRDSTSCPAQTTSGAESNVPASSLTGRAGQPCVCGVS